MWKASCTWGVEGAGRPYWGSRRKSPPWAVATGTKSAAARASMLTMIARAPADRAACSRDIRPPRPNPSLSQGEDNLVRDAEAGALAHARPRNHHAAQAGELALQAAGEIEAEVL